MPDKKVNIGCGTAILLLVGIMVVIAALIYAANHMDTLTNFIVGTIILVLIIIIMVKST